MDESVVASALIDLAGGSNAQSKSSSTSNSDIKPINLSNNTSSSPSSDATSKKAQQHAVLLHPQNATIDQQANNATIPVLPGQRQNLAMVALTVKSNDHGQRVLQLPNGLELLLQPKTATLNNAASSSPSIINSSNRTNVHNGNSSLINGSKVTNITISKAFVTSTSTYVSSNDANNNNNNNNSNNSSSSGNNTSSISNSNSNNSNNINHRKTSPREQSTTVTSNALQLQPNVFHFFSPSSSANQQNNSASANFASSSSSVGFKKRGRKRLYEGANGADGSSSSTNPIKEFRLRQRRREHEENLLLHELEEKYRNSSDFSIKLDQLYDVNNLNIHFPRIKTNLKRGKAKDDVERITRKKLCARRDSKNYRERAKMKRELITKKIHLLESILSNNSNGNTCPATIQVIHPSSYSNGSSNSSTCSSSSTSGASSSPQTASLLPVTSSNCSSNSSSPSPSSLPNLQILFKQQ